MIKTEVTIVNSGVANLLTHISNFHTREWHVSILVSDRYKEREYTIVVVLYLAACKNYCMGTNYTEGSRPKFRSAD